MREEQIPLHKIALPERLHRLNFDDDALEELEHSIRAHGLIHPISVREQDGGYELLAGHRRLRAYHNLHRTTIPARVYEAADAVNPDAIRFAENLQRADLSPMEEAQAIADYVNATRAELRAVSIMLNRSTEWCEQRVALLALPLELTSALHARRLPIGSALALAQVTDDAHRAYLLQYAVDAGATVTTIRAWVDQWKIHAAAGAAGAAPRPELPEPGQAVVVTMPCYVCATAHPYQELRILRVCADCAHTMANAGAEPPRCDTP